MLDFSWSHILIVLIVAVVVIGPKDLPRVMRSVGRWTGRARSIMSHLRQELLDVSQQAELDELRKEVNALKQSQVAPSQPSMASAGPASTTQSRGVRQGVATQASRQPPPAVGSGTKFGE